MNELSKILNIPETCPQDFYKNPAYLEQVKSALETAQSLVHSIDDEGEKKAKADAAAIRKYVKTTNSFTKTVFESMTGKIKAWRDGFTAETKKLELAADDIIDKFEEKRKKELSFIESVVMAELTSQRTLAEVGETFITRPDMSPLIKLSGTLTEKQALTSKAREFISDIVYAEKADEQQYHARLTAVKLRCLENEINPPLSEEYFGGAFYGPDQEFDFKLNQLVEIEIKRREETIAKLARQKAIDEQAAIDRAFAEREAQKEKQEFIAREQAETEKNKEPSQQDGTRLVQYTIVFQARVKDSTTNQQFKEMIKKEVVCSGRALKAIVSEEVTNV